MKIFSFFLVLILFSCKTYTIPHDSFIDQFSDLEYDESTSKTLFSNPIYYNGFVIKKIQVLDKDGKKKVLNNTPSLETRVTLINRKRKKFYFDTMKVINDTIIAHKSRFFSRMIVKIPLEKVYKIEVQEGGKNIEYVN